MFDIEKIIWAVIKNFRIVTRSWTSIGILIIGPLALMLLLGFSFSSTGFHDVKIGIFNENVDTKMVLGDISSYGSLIKYDSLEACKNGITRDNLDACLHMKNEFETSTTKIHVEVYYDNSKKISRFLVNEIESRISASSKEITKGAVDVAATNVESIDNYIDSTKELLGIYIKKLEDAGSSLDQINNNLKEMVDSIDMIINFIDESITVAESYGSNNAFSLYDNIDEIKRDNDNARTQLESIRLKISQMKAYSYNDSYIESSINDLDSMLSSVIYSLNAADKSFSLSLSRAAAIENNMDSIAANLKSARSGLFTVKASVSSTRRALSDVSEELDDVIENAKKIKADVETVDSKLGQQSADEIKSWADPITIGYSPLLKDFTNVYFLFPVLTIMIIVFVSILLSNIITLNEMHSAAYMRNYIMPVRGYVFDAGLFITSGLISLFQIFVLMVFAQYNLNIPIFPNILEISILTVFIVSIFTVIGMIIAYLIRQQQTSILVATFVGIAAFIFSNSLLPLKLMPKIAADLAAYNPIVLAGEMLRMIIFLDVSIFSFQPYFLTLGGFFVFGLALLPIARRIDKMRID